MRRLPLIPTIVVAIAVAVMISLGVWQLRRAEWKEALLARYAHAEKLPPISWPTIAPRDDQLPLFRHATGVCLRPMAKRAVAGQSATGETGYVHIVDCVTGGLEGPGMSVQIGWSKDPNAQAKWTGGPVSGIIAPDSQSRMRLVAATPAPGLQASAPPSITAIPNNHRLYTFLWFAFAGIALLIYALALRKRLAAESKK